MAGRDRRDVPDADDWWSTSAGVQDGVDGEAHVDPDDWLDDDRAARAPRSFRLPFDARIIGAAVLAVIVLVVGLIVGGVFSGGGSPQATTSTTAPTTTVTSTPTHPTATVPPPSGPLTPGATGVQVKRLQRVLKSLGFSPGKIDADYGSATQLALKRFQRAHSLTADGVLGPKTLAALKLALRSRA